MSKARDNVSRKQLLQMRLELHRQKIRHEALVLAQPVKKAQRYKQQLQNSNNPLLWVAGVGIVGFVAARNRKGLEGLLSLARTASSLLPLVMGNGTKEGEHVD